MDIDTMTVLARRLGVDPTGRAEVWRARAAQDEPVIERVRSSRVRVSSPRRARRVSPADATSRGRASLPSWERAPDERVADRVERALASIGEQRALNAFTAVFADRARRRARELDGRDAQGAPRGPLHGAVIAVKDLMAVQGYRASAGTRAFHATVAVEVAVIIERLTAAGAVLVGATNLHALAFGAFSTSGDAGVVGNPLRAGAVAGGSSGGSAAAVASGMIDLAIGTDTAGSIRIPGAACGVVGLKGTYAAAPTGGLYPLAPSLDHVGPMTRTVTDAARAWSVIRGDQRMRPFTRPMSLAGVVIGEPSAYSREYLDPPVLDVVDSALATAVGLGARVETIDVPGLDLAPALMLCTIGAEALDVHLGLLRSRAVELPDDVRLRLEVAMLVSGADYARAQRLRRQLTREMNAVLDRVDMLLLPTLPVTVPLVKDIDGMAGGRWPMRSAMSRLTAPFNLTGQPALTLPWGSDPHGGGIGVQVVGAHGDEPTVLQVASALEAARLDTVSSWQG